LHTKENTLSEKSSRQYEHRVVIVLSLTFGIVNFELLGISYLIPFIEPSLKLNNTQVGVLSAGYWIAFACSSYVAGALSDRLGKRKAILQYTLLLFSVASVLSGFANSFLALLAARLLMGLVEGPIYLIPQSILALESPIERSGINMGVMQNLGSNILAGFVAPLLLVQLASHYGWRVGFFVVALPGVICAALVGRLLREPSPREVLIHDQETREIDGAAVARGIFQIRNVWLCTVGACLTIAYVTISVGFLPLFLTKTRQFPPQQMSILMSLLGISGVLLGIALPAISDWIGRRPVVIGAGLLGVLCPLALIIYPVSMVALAPLIFFSWAPGGASSLIFATIPCESVPARSISTAMGFILAVSTLIGGVAGPTIAGWSADHWGLRMPLLLDAGCCAVIVGIALALHETAPRKTKSVAVTPISLR
jgi:ACS family hexuronate transporter-like MFS transporter